MPTRPGFNAGKRGVQGGQRDLLVDRENRIRRVQEDDQLVFQFADAGDELWAKPAYHGGGGSIWSAGMWTTWLAESTTMPISRPSTSTMITRVAAGAGAATGRTCRAGR